MIICNDPVSSRRELGHLPSGPIRLARRVNDSPRGSSAHHPEDITKYSVFQGVLAFFGLLATETQTRGKPLKTGNRGCHGHPGNYGQRERAALIAIPPRLQQPCPAKHPYEISGLDGKIRHHPSEKRRGLPPKPQGWLDQNPAICRGWGDRREVLPGRAVAGRWRPG